VSFSFSKILSKEKRGQIKEKWLFELDVNILTPPIIADLENKGDKDILFATGNGKIFCLNKDAKQKWVFDASANLSKVEQLFVDIENANSIESTPTIIDINGDGRKEIVFGSENGSVYALNYLGQLLWKYDVEGHIRGEVIARDINNDGLLELIFGSGDSHIYILRSNGQLIKKIETNVAIESTPEIIGDKIIIGNNNGEIICFDFEGNTIWNFKTEGKIIAQPAIGNLLGDNNQFIIVGSTDQNLYALNNKGELIWKYKTNGAIYSRAVLKDINNDKRLEIIFGSCDNSIYALKSNGDKIWSYETDFWVVGPVIVADIDGDGKLEIIAGSYDHNLYILDARGNYELDYVPGLSGIVQQTGSFSEVITSEPGTRSGKKLWQFETEGIIVGCAVNNEERNIIISTKTGKIKGLELFER
jgi:outer membrane protein assembly factor BamB